MIRFAFNYFLGKYQTGQSCAEIERRQGFLACLQHISKFLDKSEALLENNEKLIGCLKNYLSGQKTTEDDSNLSKKREHLYDSYMAQRQQNVNGAQCSMTHENIFYKICMDFLKNNSYPQQAEDNPKQPNSSLEDYSCWQDVTEFQEPLTLSCENLDSSYDLTAPCGSFMSFLNGYY